MKIIGAIIVAELRGYRALALMIITLFVLRGASQTCWIYEVTTLISICLQALPTLFALMIMSKSLWHDAPLRKERYLATRPTNLLKLYLGKYVAFLLMIAIPFSLVEWWTVRHFSFGFPIQAAATLQAFLFAALCIAAFIPCIWWMHSKKSIVLLWTVLLLAAAASNHYFGQLPNSYINEWSAGVPYSPFMILVMLAVFATMANLRLLRLKKCHPLLSSAFMAVTVFLSMHLTIKLFTQKRVEGDVQKFHLVQIGSYSPGQSKVSAFQVSFPYLETDRQTASQWSFTSAKVNGKDYTPWYDDVYSMRPQNNELMAILKQHYPQVHELKYGDDTSRRASFSLPREIAEQAIVQQSFTVTQKRYRWKIAIDVPYQVGAQASLSSISCRIDRNPDPRYQSSNASRNYKDFCVATVTHCKPFTKSNSDYIFGQNHLVILLDPTTGRTSIMPRSSRLYATKNFQLTQDFYHQYDPSRMESIPDRYQLYTEHARLLILVPEIIKSQSYQWSHAAPFREELPKNVNTEKLVTGMQSPESWVKDHPAPPLHASLSERELWVNHFIDYAGMNFQESSILENQYEIMQAYKMHIELFAKAHHEGRLPRVLQDYAFVNFYSRDMVKKYPNLAYSDKVIWYCYRKGWSADLVDTARYMLLRGKGAAYKDIILAEPELMNLSKEEWIEYFLLNCNADVYQKMKDRILSGEQMNQIVDQYLAYHQDVDLGLARGHVEAPHWMKLRAMGENDFYCYNLHEQLKNHFEIPTPIPSYIVDHRLTKEPILEWLKTFDPDAYVYDSAKKKYIFKPTP